jgi:phosphatidylserine decarboxylase
MICFGSRVDLYLPPEAELLVKVGDRLKAGSSVVARWWLTAA